jgi:short subunit dehydrogenase-like uncharacterized protein
MVADARDADGLRRIARRARVLVSCAGPFIKLGRAVQDAALAEGAHWLDTSGEWPFLKETFDRHDEAVAAGVVLVGAVGVDVVPSDCAAALAVEGMGELARVRVAVASGGGGLSRGTLRSMVEVVGQGGRVVLAGKLVEEPIAARRWRVRMPSPFGECALVSAPLSDIATAPRTTGAPEVIAFQPDSGVRDRLLARASWIPRLAGTRPIHAALDRLVGLAKDGPDEGVRRNSRYGAAVEAESKKGERRMVRVSAGDGYELTAKSVVLCAKLASDSGFAKRGALTPTQAFGVRVLLDGLHAAGLQLEN